MDVLKEMALYTNDYDLCKEPEAKLISFVFELFTSVCQGDPILGEWTKNNLSPVLKKRQRHIPKQLPPHLIPRMRLHNYSTHHRQPHESTCPWWWTRSPMWLSPRKRLRQRCLTPQKCAPTPQGTRSWIIYGLRRLCQDIQHCQPPTNIPLFKNTDSHQEWLTR